MASETTNQGGDEVNTVGGLIVGLLVGAMFTVGIFLWNGAPDSPSPVVDAVYVDSLDWMVSRSELVDSIFVLNEALGDSIYWIGGSQDRIIDSLLRELADVPWAWPPHRSDTIRFDTGWQPIVVRGDTIYDPVYKTPDPCAGMVSIEAVEEVAWCEPHWIAGSGEVSVVIILESTWQRLTERSR